MADTRLIHDAAYAAATALSDLMTPPSEDVREFHRLAYEIIKAAIEGYEVQKIRDAVLRGPSRN